MRLRTLVLVVFASLFPSFAGAQPLFDAGGRIPLPLGDFPGEPAVEGVVSQEFLSRRSDRRHILLVASPTETQAKPIEMLRQQFYDPSSTEPFRGRMTLATIFTSADVLADAWPPRSETPYYAGDHRAGKSLWRSLFWLAPDLVIVVEFGDAPGIALPAALDETLAASLKRTSFPVRDAEATSLAAALGRPGGALAKIGAIPAIELTVTEKDCYETIARVFRQLNADEQPTASPAHRELLARCERTPIEIARQLEAVYGKHFNSVMYQPALALVGRLNLDELLGETSRRDDIERMVSPYVDGTKPTLGNAPNGSVASGHLIFSELARRVDREKYLPLVLRGADQGFDAQGVPLAAMPAHSEMSDAVFMGTPILAAAGRLTGDEKYFAMCLRHVRFMQKLCLREDGLYRHSPLDEAAWGRGNGFPALGLAWTLAEIPAEHPVHRALRDDLRAHLRALVGHQDPTGMWHQVIDRPGTYREMTATCMIGLALIRGLRDGWLDAEEYAPVLERAWRAVVERIAPDGVLFDVCTGTGKQKSLSDYYDRPAILGVDERGGAMALLFVTEYARWKRDAPADR